jgi:hypothetical protein
MHYRDLTSLRPWEVVVLRVSSMYQKTSRWDLQIPGINTLPKVKERLGRMRVRYNFIVLMGFNGGPLLLLLILVWSIRMQMQEMKQRQRFLTRLGLKKDLDLDFKFTPSRLRHLKRRFLDRYTSVTTRPSTQNLGQRYSGGGGLGALRKVHRVGEANDSCSLNTTFFTKWEISLLPGPRTETVHWCVCPSGTTSGGFFTCVSGVAELPYTIARYTVTPCNH